MLILNTDDMRKLEKDLKTFAERALPFATRKTLNDSAFAAQSISRANVRESMINRNNYTERSIQVDQAKTLNIKRQSSSVGSTAEYMEDQEFGGTKRKTGKEGVSIATSYSAGQTGERTRLPRKPNKMRNIKIARVRGRYNNRKQRNLVAIKQAAESNNKFIFLNLGKRKGIFRLVGGKRKPKIKMVHDMTRESVAIPRNTWLRPAFEEALRMQPAFYADALRFQARRHNLFA